MEAVREFTAQELQDIDTHAGALGRALKALSPATLPEAGQAHRTEETMKPTTPRTPRNLGKILGVIWRLEHLKERVRCFYEVFGADRSLDAPITEADALRWLAFQRQHPWRPTTEGMATIEPIQTQE